MKYKSNITVGAITFNDVAISDGMNEKGLAVAAFYFPTFAKYPEITNDNLSKALSAVDFPNWILTQFATVEEVRSAIQNDEAHRTNCPGRLGAGSAAFSLYCL